MILLTGSTGFLGGAFYLEAFRRGEAGKYLLLVRGANEEACRTRLARNLTKHSDGATAELAASACGIIPGDLASLATSIDPRLDQVTRIVHVAADTSFDSRTSVWHINVDGTLALAARARRMPGLTRFLHVGTAFCVGESRHYEMVQEGPPPVHGAPHINEYTRSKAAAERALLAGFPDMPIIVARPSIVAGHSRIGCQPSSSIFWFFRLVDATGIVPCKKDGFIDIVPVDWTASRLHDLLNKPDLKHKLYHVSAGLGSRTTWTEFADAFAAVGHDSIARPYAHFDYRAEEGWAPFNEAFRRAFPQRTAINRSMAMGARKYHRFTAQDVAFDNSRLLEEGFEAPPQLRDYVGVCISNPGVTIAEQFMEDAESLGVAAAPAPVLNAAA
ncbi:SDR family oxidoreductase [Paracraurococcus lichenis]|uniref:SDR family oxidoreductase n=1 Tax=Paracraurococcus lichenis TaxID=3064888 RepID=A0ABT9E9J3_9PROT|nr:SDR family oxidoreductase [Paracraurococcus sp. LOR1-02]MDO9712730.1 SDR family oxidoreductase [Paracraurococcus sp. LOR1-02]